MIMYVSKDVRIQVSFFYICCRFDPGSGKDVAVRKQIPLCLSYGITIHKSQGMTLPHLTVFATDVFTSGQLAVALGRATSSHGLFVRGFDPVKHVLKVNYTLLNILRIFDTKK